MCLIRIDFWWCAGWWVLWLLSMVLKMYMVYQVWFSPFPCIHLSCIHYDLKSDWIEPIIAAVYIRFYVFKCYQWFLEVYGDYRWLQLLVSVCSLVFIAIFPHNAWFVLMVVLAVCKSPCYKILVAESFDCSRKIWVLEEKDLRKMWALDYC